MLQKGKGRRWAAALSALALAAAACGGGEETTTTAAPTTTTTPTAAATTTAAPAGEQTTQAPAATTEDDGDGAMMGLGDVSVGHYFGSDLGQQAIIDLNASWDGGDAVINPIEHEAFKTQILVALAGGQPPGRVFLLGGGADGLRSGTRPVAADGGSV